MMGLHQRSKTVILETKDERKEKLADDKALTESLPDFSRQMKQAAPLEKLPEYMSVEDFVQFCMDDDRDTYTGPELQALCYNVRQSASKVRPVLDGYGLTLAGARKERNVRGFSANPHNLYQGNPMSGGSGFDNGTGSRFR